MRIISRQVPHNRQQGSTRGIRQPRPEGIALEFFESFVEIHQNPSFLIDLIQSEDFHPLIEPFKQQYLLLDQWLDYSGYG
jgi:hypothetical protein